MLFALSGGMLIGYVDVGAAGTPPVHRLERGELTALEAIDALLAEEFTLRENRRVKTALVMARLSTIKTLAGFDFSFQPSLDKNRIWRWPSSSSSTAPRSCTSSARPAPAPLLRRGLPTRGQGPP